jgi:dTDP-4-dehydrorhamnose 3,5-epimerase
MVLLDSIQKNQLWIPPGFAHGFCALEDNTIFNYKCTNYYSPDSERSILWNDTDLQINWNIEDPTISAKDKQAMNFKDFISPF